MSCCNVLDLTTNLLSAVTIPQAVWAVATEINNWSKNWWKTLQYRKRYELLQLHRSFNWESYFGSVTIPQAVWAVATDLENSYSFLIKEVTIPQAVWAVATKTQLMSGNRDTTGLLQYRKRYELLQQHSSHARCRSVVRCYNTASGMSCCNIVGVYPNAEEARVTIPQAVWAVATNGFFSSFSFQEIVTIPQAVWAVATIYSIYQRIKSFRYVTIPQAVWAVATKHTRISWHQICVTIPQAVWAVATVLLKQLAVVEL